MNDNQINRILSFIFFILSIIFVFINKYNALVFFITAILFMPFFNNLIRKIFKIYIPLIIKIIIIANIFLVGFCTHQKPAIKPETVKSYEQYFELLGEDHFGDSNLKAFYTTTRNREVLKQYARHICQENDCKMVVFLETGDDQELDAEALMMSTSVVAQYFIYGDRNERFIYYDDYKNISRKDSLRIMLDNSIMLRNMALSKDKIY